MKNWNNIRQRANRLLKEAGIADSHVDVELVARFLDLKIVETDLEGDISGLLVKSDTGSCIFVKRNDSKNRKRFTIAHEIGHHYLRHDFGPEKVHVDKGFRIHARGPQARTGEVPHEVEANQFAAALLMPDDRVRFEVKELGRGGFAEEEDVALLAKTFGVSVQAMTIRLNVLELL